MFPRTPSSARPSSLLRAPAAIAGLALVLGLGIALASGITSASASVNWRGDYETGNFSQWNYGIQQKTAGRATIVASPERQGRYAARYEVDSGDNNVAGSGTGERTEALIDTATTAASEGREDWYAWSTMFAPDFSANTSWWNVFTQWHNTGTTGGTVAFIVSGNTLVFRSFGGDPANPTHCDVVFDQNRQNGVWYDFVFHVKWSANPANGFFEIFENGKRVVPQTTCATLYNGQGVYMKQGYYRTAQPNTAVIYDDGTRRGSSYADVVADFPAGTWPSTPGGSTPTTTSAPPATTSATTTTTTTAPTPTTTTSTTPAPTTTTTSTTPIPTPTTTTTTTTTTSNGNGGGKSSNNGKKPAPRKDTASGTRVLESANVQHGRPASNVRVISAAISANHVSSLRISVVSSKGLHRRVPILARSRVAAISTRYWRKTLVTGSVSDGRNTLSLRVPRAQLHHGERYRIRVRAIEPSGVKTVYLPFTG